MQVRFTIIIFYIKIYVIDVIYIVDETLAEYHMFVICCCHVQSIKMEKVAHYFDFMKN